MVVAEAGWQLALLSICFAQHSLFSSAGSLLCPIFRFLEVLCWCVNLTIFRIAHVYTEVCFRPCCLSDSHRRLFLSLRHVHLTAPCVVYRQT